MFGATLSLFILWGIYSFQTIIYPLNPDGIIDDQECQISHPEKEILAYQPTEMKMTKVTF